MEARIDTHPPLESLKAFSLGLLDDASARALYLHLEGCTPCRRRAEEASGDDFLDRLQKARASHSTPAPPRPLPPLPGVPGPAGRASTLPPDPARSLASSLFGASSPGEAPDGRPAPADIPPELVANHQYEVIRELGRGGMGVVYLARNKQMGRLEVLKVVNRALLDRPGTVERFLREIRSAAALEHKNVVRAYACLQVGKLLALVMEYVEGEDLARLVERRGPLSVASACASIIQAARGLQEAHDKGMVHRDIKPQNLLLSRRLREVLILDFGLAKVASEKGVEQGLTAANKMLGTPGYVAPEQILDAASADIRADIYSLGCTLYYLLSGHPPFEAPNLYALLHAHQNEAARPLNEERPGVPPALAAVVARMMAKNPAKRYQRPAEVAAALTPFAKGARPTAAAPPPKSVKKEPTASLSVPPPLPQFVQVELVPAPAAGRVPLDLEDLPAPAVSRMRKKGRCALVGRALALLVPLAIGFTAVLLRVQTPNGTLVVEMDDDVEARIKGGKLILTGPDGKERYILTAEDRNKKRDVGEYKIRVEGADGLALNTREFTLKRGGVVKVRVRLDEKSRSANLDAPKRGSEFINSLGMKFMWVPPGKSWMGGGGGKEGSREFILQAGLWCGAYTVTQGEWQAVMGDNPSGFSRTGINKAKVASFSNEDLKRLPVEAVNGDDVQNFIAKLNSMSKEGSVTYRLPTPDEWEYVCRGGPLSSKGQSAYHFYFARSRADLTPVPSNLLSTKQANFNNPALRTIPVRSYLPNPLGIYDMHGNVWQWTSTGPREWMVCGGAYGGDGADSTASRREAMKPDVRKDHFGFRIVAIPPVKTGSVGIPKSQATLDPDRKAAEYVLSIEGKVRVDGDDVAIEVKSDLPRKPFRLTWVDLRGNVRVTNADLACFDDCTGVTHLDLRQTKVGDVGLSHFKGCTYLRELDLCVTGVTDVSLSYFKHLTVVDLNGTRVSDKGMVHLARCRNLATVVLTI